MREAENERRREEARSQDIIKRQEQAIADQALMIQGIRQEIKQTISQQKVVIKQEEVKEEIKQDDHLVKKRSS